MSLRNKTKDGRDETDGEKGCNRLRPTRMAQNYYGLKTKNQISSFVDHGQFEYACTQTMTHNHTQTHTYIHNLTNHLKLFCSLTHFLQPNTKLLHEIIVNVIIIT
jgi:hypothetical protein